MGRYEYSERLTTEECLRLSIFQVIREEKQKDPLITEKMTDGDTYLLRFTDPRTKKEIIQPILLTCTPCYFGGKRWWFRCPHRGLPGTVQCNKRVAVLYFPPEGWQMGCRTCYDLTYRCQREKNSGFENWCIKLFQRQPGGAKSLLEARRWYRMYFGDGKWWKVKRKGERGLAD